MLKRMCCMVFTFVLLLAGAALAQLGPINFIDGMINTDEGIAHVNPGGMGDSLIYGYYNVRDNINFITLANTSTDDGAKVRIIFRNAKDSRECLDYSICLSKGDVYTAYLVDGGTTALVCPWDVDTLTAPGVPAGCQTFKYEGAGGFTGVTADDCKEGYIEVIGLSSIPDFDNKEANSCTAFRGSDSGCTGKATEADCRDWAPSEPQYDVGNTLIGNNTIIKAVDLATYSSNAVAVANTTLYPTFVSPGAEKSIPQVMSDTWDYACDVADIIFMKSNIIAPYDLMAALSGAETELVVTFPTRYACHSSEEGDEAAMFDCQERTDADADGFCDDWCAPVGISVWNDKEARLDITDFSPSVGRCLAHEVNVVRVGGSQIWNSSFSNTVSVGSFDLGWIDIDLYAGESSHQACVGLEVGELVCSRGLPAIAFTTQSFVGGYSSYMLPAAYKTSWYFD